MRQQERQDIEGVLADSKETRALARNLLKDVDRKSLPEHVDTAITLLTSGMLLTQIDLGDILSGQGRQE